MTSCSLTRIEGLLRVRVADAGYASFYLDFCDFPRYFPALDAHSVPPHSRARLLHSDLRVVRQTLASAPHALVGPQEGIVARGRRSVQRDSSPWGAPGRPQSTRVGGHRPY